MVRGGKWKKKWGWRKWERAREREWRGIREKIKSKGNEINKKKRVKEMKEGKRLNKKKEENGNKVNAWKVWLEENTRKKVRVKGRKNWMKEKLRGENENERNEKKKQERGEWKERSED